MLGHTERSRLETRLRQLPTAEDVVILAQEISSLVERELVLRAEHEARESAAHAADDYEVRP